MKTITLSILCVFLFCFALIQAQEAPAATGSTPAPNEQQNPAPAREKLQVYKIGYITHQLNLTPTEAEKFWPVFNQYQNDMTKLYDKKIAGRKSGEDASNQLNYDQEAVNIRKAYYEDFKKVLPAEKVTKLYKAEHDFKVHVIRQVAARRNAPGAGVRHKPATPPHTKPGIR